MHEKIMQIFQNGFCFQISLGLVVESLSQDGAKFHAQMLLELSWYILAEPVALTLAGGEEQQKVCMPEDPDYTSETAGLSSYAKHNQMFGSEYQFNAGPQSLRRVYQHNVPCAVCYVPTRAATIMIPAKTTCPVSWTKEYTGYLTSEGDNPSDSNNYQSSYNCR